MRRYSVAEVSSMLNVNAETIRRWIRNGKLNAKRAMGPGGNTMLLEDIIAFANIPPRAYLLPLESWLSSNGFNYQKVEDAKQPKISNRAALGAAVATSGLATAASALTSASLATWTRIMSVAGPISVGVAGSICAATKLMDRKTHQTYSIKLLYSEEKNIENSNSIVDVEASEKSSSIEQNGVSILDVPPRAEESNPGEHTEDENKHTLNNGTVTTVNSINILDEIAQAKQLLDAEIITHEEFVDIKAKLIAKI